MNRSGRIYEFGPFVLDIGERRLLRDGRPVLGRAMVMVTKRALQP